MKISHENPNIHSFFFSTHTDCWFVNQQKLIQLLFLWLNYAKFSVRNCHHSVECTATRCPSMAFGEISSWSHLVHFHIHIFVSLKVLDLFYDRLIANYLGKINIFSIVGFGMPETMIMIRLRMIIYCTRKSSIFKWNIIVQLT